MKLTAYLINGIPVSDLTQYEVSDLGGNPPFKVEATVSTGYQDISSTANWDKFGKDLCKDYKVWRGYLMVQVATDGFSNLSISEKETASKNFVVSKADRDAVHTIPEQIQNGVDFHKKSVEARHARRIAAEAEIYNRIADGLEQADLMNDVTALLDNYVQFGIEGTLEGDVEGLFDYIESRTGTSFETTGLLSKTYTIEGMTVTQLKDRLMDIFVNGNY